MTESGTPALPFKSLSRSLTRRVLLLSLIGVVGLCSTIALVFWITLLQVQERMDEINLEAVGTFDGFFQNIQSNLLTASEGFAAHKDMDSALLQIRVRNQSFLDVLYVGLDGTVLAQRNTSGRPKRTAIEQPAWLKSPPAYGEVRVGPVGFEGQLPYVDMAVTATDDIGLPAGLLVARVDLTKLWEATLDIKAGRTGYAYIADSNGQLVVSRNRRLLESGSNLRQLVGRTPQAIAASRPSFYTGLSGQPVVAVAQPLRTVPWFAVVEQPASEALAPFAIPAISLLAVLVVGGLLLTNTIRFARVRIVSPLLALRDSVGRMAEGQLEQRVEVRRNDELGQLASSFNSMAAQLQQAFLALEDRIAVLHQARDALRNSEYKFRTFIEQSSDGFDLLDEQGLIIEWNQAYERMSGVKRDEALGRPFWQIQSRIIPPERRAPDSLAHFKTVIADALRTGQSPLFNRPLEAEIVRTDGERRYIQQVIFPIKTDQGYRVGTVTRDITERKRAEEARARLATAIDQAAESIVITDTAGTIVYVNPAFERTSGYSQAEALGQTPRLLKSGKQNAAFYKTMWATISAGQVWQGRIVNRRKDGSLYTEEGTISPVRDERGAIINYVSVKRDVTRELQLEEQYYQAQKMEAVGRLTAGVAHDFNNILTAINGFSELIGLELAPDDPIQESVKKVLGSGQRAAGLVRQLMAFSRKQIVQPVVLNLNEVTANLEKMLRRIIGEDVELHTSPAPGLWLTRADATQVEQVILNLAVNARDAMPDGGKLTIETANVTLDEADAGGHLGTQPGEYVLLAVSDTGTGMNEEVKSHLFEPFYTTKELGRGTGLGLATVYGIVKQSGGDIRVYSEEGVGSTFKVYLPHAGPAAPLATPAPVRPEMPAGQETILLVEDDEAVRSLARRVLSSRGYTLLETKDGQEALRLAAEYPGTIHLLLTDVVMPGMGGTTLAEQLARSRPGLKTLYMSGYTDNAIAHHGVLDPGVAFLQKPFGPMELARKVRAVLDG
jgi:two-component system cell cycle sensor histidine kinase/response regulator CckA